MEVVDITEVEAKLKRMNKGRAPGIVRACGDGNCRGGGWG